MFRDRFEVPVFDPDGRTAEGCRPQRIGVRNAVCEPGQGIGSHRPCTAAGERDQGGERPVVTVVAAELRRRGLDACG